MTLIPATPGWRVLVWDRSNDGAITLPIVAWEETSETEIPTYRHVARRFLTPWVQSTFGEEVAPLDFEDQSTLFVAILAPRDKRYEWDEQAHQVAKAAYDADEREERKIREASS